MQPPLKSDLEYAVIVLTAEHTSAASSAWIAYSGSVDGMLKFRLPSRSINSRSRSHPVVARSRR